MIIRLKLTEDHLKLLKCVKIEDSEIADDTISIPKNPMLNIQSHILDDVATVLGMRDKAIPGTENDPDGAAYPDEDEAYMLSVYWYVSDNLYWIETLLHQMATEGIKCGTYVCKDNEMIWTKEEDHGEE